MNTEDKIVTGEQVKNLMVGLINGHMDNILDSYSKSDDNLSVNLKFTLKGDDQKVSVTSTLNYAKERVKDHANATIDVRQGTLRFEDAEQQGPSEGNMAGDRI